MKIRTDYVSNSSSSSFVVVLQKGYKFSKFVKDVARACIENPEYEEEGKKSYLNGVKRRNITNMEYCLNNYVLLFLGRLTYGVRRDTITGVEDCNKFRQCGMKWDPSWHIPQDTIVSSKPDEIIVDTPLYTSHVTVPESAMRRIRHWQAPGVSDEDYRRDVVQDIVKCCGSSEKWGFTNDLSSSLYEITLDTIKNTEDLIASGVCQDLYLEPWCSDLGALKRRIENGDRIFGICVNHEGNGEDANSIYAVSGWDSDFNKYANVEILTSDCG